jgi:hypothetical protein
MIAINDEEIELKERANAVRDVWLKRHSLNGFCPDTSRFDYSIAPFEAKRRNVSVYQVILEFYTEPEPRPPAYAYGSFHIHQVQGGYCIRSHQKTNGSYS